MAKIAVTGGRVVGGTYGSKEGAGLTYHGEWQAEVIMAERPDSVRVIIYRHKRKLPHDRAKALLDKVKAAGIIDTQYWETQRYSPYRSDYFGYS